MDIRVAADENGTLLMDPVTHKPQLYILESNALCSLSDSVVSTAGAIMHSSGKTMKEFIVHILSLALYNCNLKK